MAEPRARSRDAGRRRPPHENPPLRPRSLGAPPASRSFERTPVVPPRPVDKPCAHYPDCVGCPLIGRPYGEQLIAKHELVRAALAPFPRLQSFAVPEVIGSPRAFGYRNQVKLVVRKARRGRLLGVFRPGTHQIVDIRECPVHHPLINEVLAAVARVLDRYDIQAYDERTHHGVLRYVLIRVGIWNKTAQVVFVTRTEHLPHERELVKDLRRVPGVVSIIQNINPEPGNVILGREFRALTKDETLMEKINGLKLFTHAGAFVQANSNIAGRIYRQATAWAELGSDDCAVDLYCGAGALTFHLAGEAKLVVGVEESPVAVADAKMNVRMNGFHNVRFRCGDAAALLPEIAAELGELAAVTLNPPRKGADAAMRAAILAAAPGRIVYVSCDPQTLARDMDELIEGGYRLAQLQPYDMLPQTEHVECVALLTRQLAAPPVGEP